MLKYIIYISILLTATIGYSQNLNNISTKKPFNLSGSISAGGFTYNTNRAKSFLQPYGYSLNLNVNASFYGINIPLNLNLNQQGTNFNTPFNRFGMSPTYKGVTLHLGHRNFYWSEFLLAGATVFGVGLDLKYHQYRLGIIEGSLRPALGLQNPNFNVPQFSRSIEVIRFGSSTEDEYFYITLARGKDDINSLPQLSKEQTALIQAQENNALSVSFKSSIVGNKVFVTFKGATSAFTENIRNPTIPTDKIPKFRFVTKLFDLKPSTHIAYALKGTANYTHKNFKLQLVARKLSPEFKTFGTNYLISDMITYTVNPQINVWKNKLSLSGSYGIMYNDLDNRLINKTSREIGSASLSFNPSQTFGTTINYSNYSIYQQVIKDSLANDSILKNQINHNVNITPRLTFVYPNQVHSVLLNANYQILDDKNEGSKKYSENNIFSLVGNYTLSLIKTGYNFTLGVSYLQFQSSQLSTNQKGVNLGIRKSLFDKKLKISIRANYSKLFTNDKKNDLFTLSSGINYSLTSKSSINFQFYLLNKKSSPNPVLESKTQLNYRYRF